MALPRAEVPSSDSNEHINVPDEIQEAQTQFEPIRGTDAEREETGTVRHNRPTVSSSSGYGA